MFFSVPLVDWLCAHRQVSFIGRCFLDINSLALKIRRVASFGYSVSARLGRLAQPETSF
uniref:Uncharacterized protein n=1 Tax=Vibrio alginolyticus TaxID=663 RepID=I1ZES0_VIBAL|nr:hypothetical protein VAR2-1 [Vibrio alginolyticus]